MFDKMKGLLEMQKKMQEVAAEKMKAVVGFNIPGLI